MIERVFPEQRRAVSDEAIVAAIAIKANACYGALAICRGLSSAGFDDDEWWLARNYSLRDLVQEADGRGLDLSNAVTSVERTPITSAMKYRHAKGEVSDADLAAWWRKIKNNEIEP
jgi:hypothetical protein